MTSVACPHFDVSIRQRSKGQSAVAGAAYMSAEKLFCEYDQRTKNFCYKQKEIVAKGILLPPNAPREYTDRQTLWNAVEASEKQWNAQLARGIIMALPRELPADQYESLVREYCMEQFVLRGMIVDYAIHDKGDGNPHAHVMEDSQLADRLSFYADDIKNDGSILFLRVMNKNKDALYDTYPILAPYRTVYRWFRFKLSVNYPDEPITQYTYFFDSEGSAAAEELLARFDTGISKVQVCDEPTEKLIAQFPKRLWSDLVESLTEQKRRYEEQHQERIPAIILRMQEDHSMYIFELIEEEVRCKTLKFQHKHGQSLFSLKEESDGTIRLLDLLEVLLANNSDMVYVIDEVSRCLHPLLTKKFIGDFLALAAERNIQLIVTTHEADLMDLDLLRQDEIGFVGKRDEDGTSKIFGLDEFGARFDKRIRKAYLDGEYGGIPNLSNGKLVPHM